jgi:hypothetical protein
MTVDLVWPESTLAKELMSIFGLSRALSDPVRELSRPITAVVLIAPSSQVWSGDCS